MKKKLFTMLIIAAMSASMMACGGTKETVAENAETKKEDQAEPVKQEEPEEAKEPVDLSGTWASEPNNGAWMEAVIEGEVITINWVSDNGDTKSIYWIGTYTAPTEYTDEYKWTSDRDKEQTDNAMLASTNDTKEFTFANDEITYSASALGTTKTVHLKRSK